MEITKKKSWNFSVFCILLDLSVEMSPLSIKQNTSSHLDPQYLTAAYSRFPRVYGEAH